MPNQTDPKRRAGRPGHTSAFKRTSVVLFDRQLNFLDRLRVSMRERTSATVSRTQIVRALVDALDQSQIDVGMATSEAELTEVLRESMEAESKKKRNSASTANK